VSAPDPAAEAEALDAWKAGDILAGDRLVRMHEGLIRTAVSSYVTVTCEMDDLMQMGRLALLEAADIYDSGKAKFSTWARLVMWRRAGRFAIAGRYVVPGAEQGLRSKDAHPRAARLDAPIGDGTRTLGDIVAAPEPVESKDIDVAPLISALPPHERDLIQRHYFEPSQTLVEIAATRGVSKQAAHSMKNRAIDRMRHAAGFVPVSSRNAALAAQREADGATSLRCSLCGEERHNKRTCPLRQAA
jgi:RNA polymerase sigma factor (sigma-70 family)